MLCHVMPCQACHTMSVMSCHVKSSHCVMPRHAISSQLITCMLCHAILICHYHISCQSMPCHVITCISCNVIPCQVRSLYYAMKYHVKSSHYMYVTLSRVITLYCHIMSVMLSHVYHVM